MDDLISRQDVLDYIDTMPSELTSDGRRMIRRVTLTEYIADTLPSAEPYTEEALQKIADLEQVQFQKMYELGVEEGKASAERKGKWIRHTRVEPVYSIDGVETWGIKCQCNKCCFATTVVEDFGYYKFCPNCGADMRGENDEKPM